ncbi:MAG: hypothetical protein GXX91_03460 [Verrucomicrobiaceae bacterium]|nr:hypothetical protein [Verrucomicrobiaceae bacterium]
MMARQQVHEELRRVEGELAAGDTVSLDSARARLDQLERWLDDSREDPESGDWHEIASTVATARGHLERVHYRIEAAESAYAAALAHLEKSSLDELLIARRSANLLVYQGLARLAGKDPGDWKKAAERFGESIRLREADPERTETLLWGLSAAWMNRGEALSRSGDAAAWEESIRCQEKARAILADFDLSARADYRSRFALCHLNIAAAKVELTTRHARPDPADALAHYARAAEILRVGAEAGIEESKRVLAVVLTNASRARLLLDANDLAASAAEATEALRWMEGYGADDWEMVNLELTARCTLCLCLHSQGREGETAAEAAAEITNLAEEGLEKLARHLSLGGVPELFDPVAGPLFRFAAEAYAQHMPRFLEEFLLEHLDPERGAAGLERSAACHEAAVETLWAALGHLKRGGFSEIGTEAYERRVEREIEWDRCRVRLAEVRAAYFEI